MPRYSPPQPFPGSHRVTQQRLPPTQEPDEAPAEWMRRSRGRPRLEGERPVTLATTAAPTTVKTLIADMVRARFTPHWIQRVSDALSDARAQGAKPNKTPKQLRDARYYAKKRRRKASEITAVPDAGRKGRGPANQ